MNLATGVSEHLVPFGLESSVTLAIVYKHDLVAVKLEAIAPDDDPNRLIRRNPNERMSGRTDLPSTVISGSPG